MGTVATISFEADKFSLIALVFQDGGSKVLKSKCTVENGCDRKL